MARTNNLNNFLTDVANAIRTKKGTQATIAAADFDTEIENLPSGSRTEAPDNDVNFYDYDGFRIYSYTAQEFLALESMPANPTHEGLTAQGWNWSLADAKTYVTDYVMLEIGQTYITDDGKTRIYISLDEGRLSPYLGFAINGTATVDWGDETTSTVTGSSASTIVSTQHIYSEAGDYVISISSENKIVLKGDGNTTILWNNTIYGLSSIVYQNSIKKIELGNNIQTLGNGALRGCRSIETITMPKNVTSVGQYALYECNSLKCLILSSEMTNLGGSFSCISLQAISLPKDLNVSNGSNLGGCDVLRRLTLPTAITTFSNSELMSLKRLVNIKIPSNIITIGNYFLSYANSLRYCDFSKHTVVPTLGTGAFSSCPDDYKIVVPNSLYEDWIAANNWSNLSSHIIKKSDWDAL